MTLPITPTRAQHYADFVRAVTCAQIGGWLPARRAHVLLLGTTDPAVTTVCERHRLLHTLDLSTVGTSTVDAVIGGDDALSGVLGTESVVADALRVLRPGGRALLTVDSLVAGMARLAEQSRWEELADVPSADVVLVPGRSGSLRRCFWPEALHALVEDAGFEVEWVRPRTVLTPATVERALAERTDGLGALVRTETALAMRREDGAQLVVAALARL